MADTKALACWLPLHPTAAALEHFAVAHEQVPALNHPRATRWAHLVKSKLLPKHVSTSTNYIPLYYFLAVDYTMLMVSLNSWLRK